MDRLEGQAAKDARESQERLIKMFGGISSTMQVIVICTDVTGRVPTHVHVQGPSSDNILMYGMLETAKDVIRLASQKKSDAT